MTTWLTRSCYEHGDSGADVAKRLEHMVDELDLEYYSFMVLRPPRDLPFDVLKSLRTNYPDEWIARYTSKRYYQLDPVTDLAIRTIKPFYWGQTRFLREFRKPQRLVFDEARAYRIMYGLAIPLRGPGGEISVFNVVSGDKKHMMDVTRGEHERLFAAAFDTHDLIMAEQKAARDEGGDGIALSVRERECLIWTLEGKTAGEIATILGLSVSTVNHHASTAARKLGCVNKHHAAVQALRSGLIH